MFPSRHFRLFAWAPLWDASGLGHDYVLKHSLNLNELQSVIFCTVQPQQCHDFMSVKNQSKTPERQTLTSINVQMFAAP